MATREQDKAMLVTSLTVSLVLTDLDHKTIVESLFHY